MITNTIKELYRIFKLFNGSLFEDKLEEPVILIQSAKKTRTLGTCSVDKVWQHKKVEKSQKYEITISAESLQRPISEIAETLLHEMVHLHCSLNDIKDTSNNFVYHNKRYKKAAEEHGLNVEKEQTIGWAYTSLTDKTKGLIESFDIKQSVFNFYRTTFSGIKIKTKTFKYNCPCGIKISHYKDIALICGICKKPFELNNEEELQALGF